MFVLRNVSKLIFGAGGQESMIDLPQGQLYLVRPLSPKGYSELIFKDASARIRRTGQDFQYQLVVQRVFEEGEAELLAEEGDEDAEIDALASDRDEKTFLLDEAIHFRVRNRENSGEKVLCWKDLSGDAGDVFEFVCDPAAGAQQIDQFELVAKQCQYERKYRKPFTTASDQDLQQFEFDEQPIPQASPLHSPTLARSIDSVDQMSLNKRPTTTNIGVKRGQLPAEEGEHPETPVKTRSTAPPKFDAAPEPTELLAAETAELHFFDFPSGAFVLQDASVTASVTEIGNWKYWLNVEGKDRSWLGIPVIADINPVFNFEFLSFIFNQFSDDGSAYSWLLRFKDQAQLERFQEGLLRALWEQLNEIKWTKVKETERDYVTDAFADLAMEDAEAQDAEPEEEEHTEEEEEDEEEDDDSPRSEHYDSDEDEDDVAVKPNDKETNKAIAVGYKHDRSFVVRGSKIGVFKHTPNNKLEFSTTISKVETPGGKLFTPKKVMLHNEDNNMILQNDADPNKLYRMDLEYGKVVDEWKIHDDIPALTFAPENKFAQMTSEPTFLGISRNALYRVDPRLSGNKLVDSQLKQYVSKNDFSSVATTEKGHIAVASNKGDIRLFDRLGINAKTHIPALGEPIIGLDVSADGRWVLATCRTYLLLIDAQQKSGKNEGKLGFEKSFAADAKPQPRRLALTPEHVAQFAYETGKGVSFTPAKFNAGQNSEETSIISATGPYVIEWNLKRVLRGQKAPYMIKRYADTVKADDFRFGSDRNVIYALPNEVNMLQKEKLKRPTRESIAGPSVRRSAGGYSTPRRGGPVDRLRKEDIVNSPY